MFALMSVTITEYSCLLLYYAIYTEYCYLCATSWLQLTQIKTLKKKTLFQLLPKEHCTKISQIKTEIKFIKTI